MSTSVGAVYNHFPSAEGGFTTTLSSTIGPGATTVGLNSLDGYTAGEVATFIVAPSVSSEKQVFTGIVDTAGLQLTNVVWTSGDNQTHAAGTTVVDYVTATHISQMTKGILVEHNQDGTHDAITATSINATNGTFTGDITEQGTTLTTMRDEWGYDFVASGCIWTGDAYGSTRLASMTAGVVYINGKRIALSAVTGRTFTASTDTYIDVSDAGVISYNEVSNNTASPALAANSIRIGIIVTGATNILNAGSVNQGQLDMILPLVSSEYLRGADTRGNPIYNTNPIQIEYWRTGTSSPVPIVEADVAGCTTTFTLTKPAKISVDLSAHVQLNSGATRQAYWKLYVNGSAYTQIYNQDNPGASETHLDSFVPTGFTLAAGTHTIKVRAVGNTASTIAMTGSFRIRIR